jgi:hypothetical protein
MRPDRRIGVSLALCLAVASLSEWQALSQDRFSPKAMATVDLTGYWVSLVNEDWSARMLLPEKGDVAGIPATPLAIDAAKTWDPAKDETSVEACKNYGAAAIMRTPTRIHIYWQDENTLRVDTDAGMQTRRFHFGVATQMPASERTLQGFSVAEWAQPHETGGPTPGGTLKVVTTNLRPAYLRRNGVPYGERATVTEYFNRTPETYGVTYLIVTTIVEDPDYLFGPFVTSSHFKKLPDTVNGWDPTPCSAP